MWGKFSRYVGIEEVGKLNLEEWKKVVFDEMRKVVFICMIGCLGEKRPR